MWYRAVSSILGIVLVAAGCFKLEVALAPVSGWIGSLQLQPLLPFAEILLGIWLLSGTRRTLARYAALACFATFSCVACYHLVRSDSSCGCLGRIPVAPWMTLAFDVVSICSLLCCRPTEPSARYGTARALAVMAGTGTLLAVVWWVSSLSQVGVRLQANPSTVDLGTVSRGGVSHGEVILTNRSLEPVVISSFETSCPCVRVSEEAVFLRPAESSSLRVTLDLSGKPEYRGRLRLEVWPRSGPDNRRSWSIPVEVRVE
jgi:hypothetical protein